MDTESTVESAHDEMNATYGLYGKRHHVVVAPWIVAKLGLKSGKGGTRLAESIGPDGKSIVLTPVKVVLTPV